MLREIHNAWFKMTAGERRAVCLVLALLLLGLLARHVLYRSERPDPLASSRTAR